MPFRVVPHYTCRLLSHNHVENDSRNMNALTINMACPWNVAESISVCIFHNVNGTKKLKSIFIKPKTDLYSCGT